MDSRDGARLERSRYRRTRAAAADVLAAETILRAHPVPIGLKAAHPDGTELPVNAALRAAAIAADIEAGPVDRLNRRRRRWRAYVARKGRRSGQQRKSDDADRVPH